MCPITEMCALVARAGPVRVRIGLRVGGDRVHDLAHQPVIDGRIRRRGPAFGNGKRQLCGALGIIVGLVEQRQRHGLGHSAETSATAARAADSSTIAFLAANAAINEETARLFTCRGRPRETSWISATASSEKSVSERLASAK